jgi:hypothetical protein
MGFVIAARLGELMRRHEDADGLKSSPAILLQLPQRQRKPDIAFRPSLIDGPSKN